MDYDKYARLWQAKKNSSTHYAHIYLEKPAMLALTNELDNNLILDLGCGSGEDLIILSVNNRVVGLDSSKELLKIAECTNEDVELWHIDLNNQEIPDKYQFDIIYSSLTMHYVKDWNRLFKQLNNILKPKGKIIFSTHHPIKWGSEVNKNKEFNEFKLGYRKDKNNQKSYQVYGDYLNTYPVKENLFQQLEIIHYNRSLSEMFKIFANNGFVVKQFIEPKPVEECKNIVPDFYEVHSKIPLFVIWELEKI
jgi:SAM-dependent methyltransferase